METIDIHGIITLHEYPAEWSDEEFKARWERMSEGEKRSRQVRMDDGKWQVENLITNAGIALILTNLSVAGQGMMNPVTQILSVGNGAITGVTRADTAVAGDAFGTNARKAPTSFTVTGFSTSIVTNYASGDANGSWTNIGFYGWKTGGSQNATTSAGTGALLTHALFSYTKGASAIAVNYTFVLSN